MGERLANPLGRLNKVHRIVIVLINTRRDREDVRIKNNVFRRKADFLDQQVVGACANLLASLKRIGLTLLIKRHHHCGCAIAATQPGLFKKRLFALFERNRIHDRLALHALQTRFDD